MKLKTIINRMRFPTITDEDNKLLREKRITLDAFKHGITDPLELPKTQEIFIDIAKREREELDHMLDNTLTKYGYDPNNYQIWTDGTIRIKENEN